jgi:hypothetical protein
MNLREIGRQRGREAARQASPALPQNMENAFRSAKALYPTLADIDLAAALRDYDRERLACTPDYAQFPEMRGLGDRHLGEREGFREASGLDETAVAFHFSWFWFLQRRINSRHAAYYETQPPPSHCTNVFFPNGAEGITVSDNRDDILAPSYRAGITAFRPAPIPRDQPIGWCQGGVSSAVPMDEEPLCIFPCNPVELVPPEAMDDVRVRMEFMTRYREFWGPGNQIWVDKKLNAVAVEKTNCRVAFRFPQAAGAACITACSYLDPELHAFKQECLRKVMKVKKENESTSTDWNYDLGAFRRNERLVKLTNAEAARSGGATLWGALEIVADEAVPFPDRICLAGQKVFPDRADREHLVNWSLTQHAAVITGPNRRILYRSIQDFDHPRSVTTYKPKLRLGEGVQMQPEWEEDIRQGRCELG